MTLLISGLWPGLVGAVLLGACIGAITGLPRERAGLAAAGLLSLLLAILAGLALVEIVPGQAGLWVETATLMLGSYLAGCVAGGLGRMAALRG